MGDTDWEQAHTPRPRRGWVLLGVVVAVVALGAFARGNAAGGPDGDGQAAGTLDIRQDTAGAEAPDAGATEAPEVDGDAAAADELDDTDGRNGGEGETGGQRTSEPSTVVARGTWSSVDELPIESRHTPPVASETGLYLWGGRRWGARQEFFANGAVLGAGARRWRRLPPAPLEPRSHHVVVWTPHGLVVWGGIGRFDHFDDGARYDPETRSWAALSPAPLTPRAGAAAAWVDGELIIAGGSDNSGAVNDAAAYDPVTEQWRRLPGRVASRNRGWNDWAALGGDDLTMYQRSVHHGSRPAVRRFDPRSGMWTSLPSPPQDGPGSLVRMWPGVDGLVAVSMGYGVDDGVVNTLADGARPWRPVRLPTDLRLGLVASGDIHGAVSGDGRYLYLADLDANWWRLHLRRQTWQRLEQADRPGTLVGAATVGDRLVVMLGSRTGPGSAERVAVWSPGTRDRAMLQGVVFRAQ